MAANEVFEIEHKAPGGAVDCTGTASLGTVKEALAGGMYRVKLDDGPIVLSYVCGKMQKHHIRIVTAPNGTAADFYELKRTGDRVTVAFSPYDPKKGRIVYRAR